MPHAVRSDRAEAPSGAAAGVHGVELSQPETDRLADVLVARFPYLAMVHVEGDAVGRDAHRASAVEVDEVFVAGDDGHVGDRAELPLAGCGHVGLIAGEAHPRAVDHYPGRMPASGAVEQSVVYLIDAAIGIDLLPARDDVGI